MPENHITIPAIVRSLCTEEWKLVNTSYPSCNHFVKDSIYVGGSGIVRVKCNDSLLAVPISLRSRIRLMLAYREQRRVQLDAAWRKATTLQADAPTGKAKVVMDALQGMGGTARPASLNYKINAETYDEMRRMLGQSPIKWTPNP